MHPPWSILFYCSSNFALVCSTRGHCRRGNRPWIVRILNSGVSAIIRTHKNPIYVSHLPSHHPFFHPSTVSPSHEMNATHTGDLLPDVSPWELWGVIWLGYISASGLVVLIYDTLLTLDDEVRPIFSYFVPPYHLFLETPCLARAPFLAKSTLLHQSLPIHCDCYLFKLPSAPHFLWLVDPSVERDHQKFPTFTHNSPSMWVSFIHLLQP